MKCKAISALVLIVCVCQALTAQVVRVSPIFPQKHSDVTITYDATQGNGALTGVTPIYAHTGLITNRSSTPTDWKYTQGNWGTADAHVLMTDIGGNKHRISYNVANFYGDNTTDTLINMAFVFRNASGSIVGRSAAGTDILVRMYDDSLHCGFINPTSNSFLGASLNSTMNFFCAASENCTMTLYANGNILSQVVNDSLIYNNFNFLHYGSYHFVLVADNGVQVRRDSMDVMVNPPLVQQDPPAGTKEGITYLNDTTVMLCILAPYKTFGYVLGEFEGWAVDTAYMMKRALDGERWWLQVTHLIPGKEYAFQYDIDGIRVGDPYCDKVLDPGTDPFISTVVYPNLKPYPTGLTNGIVSVLQTAQTQYQWNDGGYHRPNKHNLVIYELLVRDFVPQHSWKQLVDSLPYLQTLGINAIELMPVMNFEGINSWGYNPNYYEAPDKTYGDKNGMKRFIDTCHARGIAVLLDIALNDAFGTCPMVQLYWDAVNQQPAANNPWFNQVANHPFSVGYDFNHNTRYTQNFIDRVNRYWIKEFHADGYRFDLTKGYTQTYSGNDVGLWAAYDTMRVRLLERMVDSIWAADSTAILVFEHLADNPEQIELSNHGIMLWGNMNAEYNQCTMGYPTNADISWGSYQARGWSNANLVTYMESHDEERLMYKNLLYGDSIGGYNAKILDTALAREECAGALFFPVPGPKMVWQFGERGYDISINYNCRICSKPQHWEYMRRARRVHLYKVWAALIKLKTTYAPFTTTTYNVDMAGVVKKIWLNHTAFNVDVVGNFDVVVHTTTIPLQHTGWWYDYFSGDSTFESSTNKTMRLNPGEYHVYTDKKLPLPDLSVPATPNDIDEVTYTNGKITVYPMPTEGLVHFICEDSKVITHVSVYDMQGRMVYDREAGSGPEFIMQMPDNLSSGLYVYHLQAGGEWTSGNLMYTK